MNQEEIKAELEKLDSFRSDCEGKMITLSAALDEFITMVSALKAQLAEAEKPELRPGAYGYFSDQLSPAGQDGFVVYDFDGDDVLFTQENRARRCRAGKEYFRQHIIAILGNIFDDLKALSEPLKNFSLKQKTKDTIICSWSNAGNLLIQNPGTTRPICIERESLPEFILSLRRLIFTAEQEAPHE